MKKIYYMLLLAVIAVTVVSCDGWDPPYSWDNRSLVGSWESYYGCEGNYVYDIVGYDQVRYDFYANRTGRWTCFDRYYRLTYVDFDWDAYGSNLIIRYYDGDTDYLYYDFDRNGDLLLSLDRDFYHYTAYRPSGFWAPATEMSKVSNNAAKESSKDSVTSRAVKSKNELTETKEK